MPRYKMNVVIEYDAKREDANDMQSHILLVIDRNLSNVIVTCDEDAEELQAAPKQPDESGS